MDLDALESLLIKYQSRPLVIGSFSAASNVTGVLTDTIKIASLLHKHNALAFFDYAACGPYVKIDMQGEGTDPLSYKDAVFLSPHKFIGGPGTPGVLIFRQDVLYKGVGVGEVGPLSHPSDGSTHPSDMWGPPDISGGGTVNYVNPVDRVYLDDPVARFEGGTPAIIESVRAGLVVALKDEVGTDVIQAMENDYLRRGLSAWADEPNIIVLGNTDVPRLAVVSFVISHNDGYLHHNFVTTLLNDLFGIQARGGCSCASPYGHLLLGISLPQSRKFEAVVVRGVEGIKPGWTRVNFHYSMSESEFQFVVKAVAFVARHGAKFLGDYNFDVKTGLWRHVGLGPMPEMTDVFSRTTLFASELDHPAPRPDATIQVRDHSKEFDAYLMHARREALKRDETHPGNSTLEPPAVEDLRWFLLPDGSPAPHDHISDFGAEE